MRAMVKMSIGRNNNEKINKGSRRDESSRKKLS
jgi:hypothetical protein